MKVLEVVLYNAIPIQLAYIIYKVRDSLTTVLYDVDIYYLIFISIFYIQCMCMHMVIMYTYNTQAAYFTKIVQPMRCGFSYISIYKLASCMYVLDFIRPVANIGLIEQTIDNSVDK